MQMNNQNATKSIAWGTDTLEIKFLSVDVSLFLISKSLTILTFCFSCSFASPIGAIFDCISRKDDPVSFSFVGVFSPFESLLLVFFLRLIRIMIANSTNIATTKTSEYSKYAPSALSSDVDGLSDCKDLEKICLN